MGQEEQQLSMATNDNYSNMKINRNFFDFQYIIGKRSIRKILHILYNNK